jgi:hypothetical protein
VVNPGRDDLSGSAVVPKGFEQNLPPAVELPAKDPVRTVGFVQSTAAVLDVGPEVLCRMFVLEALDPLSLGASEEKANHHVLEASIDEVFDNCAQLGFSAELFE